MKNKKDTLVSLTKKLISIKSAPENKQSLHDILKIVSKELAGFTIEWFEKEGVKSILVYNSVKRPKKFKVILNGHLDIIPGKDYQYRPKILGNKLYGVGSVDMKGSIAAFITVFRDIAKKVQYPLAIQLVTDEEVGGFNGTKYQIDQGVRTDFAIVGETTNFKIENQAKGILWVKVFAKGKTAHGAYPWKGDNAIWKMSDFLNRLAREFPIPNKLSWVTTINLARIETSNQTFNKIPDDCAAWLDIRYIPQDSETIIKVLKALLPKGLKLSVLLKEPAQYVPSDSKYLTRLQDVGKKVINKEIPLNQGQGSSDARHYTRVKCEAIEFGPIGEGMGTDNEWVDISSLDEYCNVLNEFLLSLPE